MENQAKVTGHISLSDFVRNGTEQMQKNEREITNKRKRTKQ